MVDIPHAMSGAVLVGHGGPEKLVYRDDIALLLLRRCNEYGLTASGD
jgi:hypothetical protein